MTCAKTTINTMKDKPAETESEKILPGIEASDALTFIKEYRSRNSIKISIATLNINSLPNSFPTSKKSLITILIF